MGVSAMGDTPLESDEFDDDAPMMLGRDAILGINDADVEAVPVPEWGGAVFVRSVSGAERDRFEAESIGTDGTPNLKDYRARFAAMVICDNEGNLLFGAADIAELTKRNANALDRIVEAGLRLNAMADGDIEALEKN